MNTLTLTSNELETNEYKWKENLIYNCPYYAYWYSLIYRLYQNLLKAYPQLQYREYQVVSATILLLRRKHIIAFSMGIGKTLQSLLAVKALMSKQKRIRKGQIHICVPDYLTYKRWSEELNRLNLTDYQLLKSHKELLKSNATILIYTHDFAKLQNGTVAESLTTEYKPWVLIIDEIHRLGDRSTLKSKSLSKVIQKAYRIIGLSGTISDYQPVRIHDVCDLIYGYDWPYTKEQFTRGFVSRASMELGYTQEAKPKLLSKISFNKASEYYNLLRNYVYRITLEEVKSSLNLPIPQINYIETIPTVEHAKLYNDFLALNKSNYQKASQGCTEVSALQMLYPLISLSNSPSLTSSKLLSISLLPKTVIFYTYNNSKDKLLSYLKEKGLSEKEIEIISGEMGVEERYKALSAFQYSSEVRVGIFSLKLAAESIDITAAQKIIFYCIGWSNTKIQQAICRAVRSGNPNKIVEIDYLYTKGFVDEYQVKLIKAKQILSNNLLDYSFEEDSSTETVDLKPTEILKQITNQEEPPF